MAFINEYISEEDRKKYKIDELFLERNPQHKKVPEYWDPHWCRDKNRDLYLMSAGITNQAVCEDVVFYFHFFVNGELFEYTLRYGPDRSGSFSEDPYVVSWELVNVKKPLNAKLAIKDVTSLFKEALVAYGYNGRNKWVENIEVKFSF